MTKKLDSLLPVLDAFQIFGPIDIQVAGIESDSRKVKQGVVFVAIKGLTFDGHDFIPQVVKAGAVAIVGEKDFKKIGVKNATYVKVPNSRKALSLLASAWYGFPTKAMRIIGVTGTDGKTTTANLIYAILKSAGKKVGLISTVNAKIGGVETDTGLHVTNPEPLLLQELLAKMVKGGCECAVLEVTSHGLDQERVAGIDFEVGVLTNITHEHLDYHKTFENYLKAKAKLFKNVKVSVLNHDDKNYNRFRKLVGGRIATYGAKDGDFTFSNFPFTTSLEGSYNRYNILAAVAVAKAFAIPDKIIRSAIKSFKAPEGRMEKIGGGRDFEIFIDFAHTPNALASVLSTLADSKKGKLIAVFGCAGERDKEKRTMMGEISGRLADFSVFTAEDPRSEDVNEIIRQMVVGARKVGLKELLPTHYYDSNRSSKHWFFRILERGEAITFAIQKLARKGDTLVICGKGHEKSMAYGGIEYPWSDQEAVMIALAGGVKKIKR